MQVIVRQGKREKALKQRLKCLRLDVPQLHTITHLKNYIRE
jgi:hypothetical protein